MQKLLTKVVDLIYENSCLICNKASKHYTVCKDCENDFIERKDFTKHFPEITVFSWGMYEDKLRQGILQLKSGKKKLANYFSEKLVSFWEKIPRETKNKDYLVIPIPSHKKRIKERGYCQSTLIAKEFAKSLRFKFSDQIVIRTKETLFMNSLPDINHRLENIKNAFKIVSSISKKENLLIIDDILTSGSTMCEIAKTIHKKYPDANLIGLTVASGDTYQ